MTRNAPLHNALSARTSKRGSRGGRIHSDPRSVRLFHEPLEDRRLLAVTWEAIGPAGGLMYRSDVASQFGELTTIFADDFESGELGPAWSTRSSSGSGIAEVSRSFGRPAYSGTHHLALGTSGRFSLNEAILSLDLSGRENVRLAFAHKALSDEDDPLPASFGTRFNGDGVSISEDGLRWHTLVSLNHDNSPNEIYTHFDLDLDDAAAAAGISLGSGFQIKFQQYDDFRFSIDGRVFDDVLVTAADAMEFSRTTTAFLEADQKLTVVATPRDPTVALSVVVRDPGNRLLASKVAAAPGAPVDIQTINIQADGDYLVEVSGDDDTAYDLTLFRNATVEVVDLDDAAGSGADATESLIPLGSG